MVERLERSFYKITVGKYIILIDTRLTCNCIECQNKNREYKTLSIDISRNKELIWSKDIHLKRINK